MSLPAARFRPERGMVPLRGALIALVCLSSAGIARDEPARGAVAFDIPGQRLATALVRLGEASNIDVLLDEPHAANRRSAPVVGRYTPPQALTIMLDGTGLVARFTSPNAAVVVARERANDPLPGAGLASSPGHAMVSLDTMRITAPRLVGGAPASGDTLFVLALASRIRQRVLDGDALVQGTEAHMRIRTRINRDGTLHDVEILSSNGDPRRDRRVVALLEGTRLDLDPPAGLRQPLVFDLAAR